MTYICNMIEDLSTNTLQQVTFEDILKEKLSEFKDMENSIINNKTWKRVVNNKRLKQENKLLYYYNVLGFLQSEGKNE